MIDFTLTEEQLALQELAREFAEREIQPVVKEREALNDPSQRFPWDLVEAGSSLGLRTLGLPPDSGGAGANALAQCIVDEELASGDVGVATIFSQTSRLARTLFRFCSPEQRSRYLAPVSGSQRGLIAVADADADASSESASGAGERTRAERQGDGYLLNGHKLMVTLGAEASLVLVLADVSGPEQASNGQPAVFLVSSPADGLRVGKIWTKVGQRLISSADLVLE
ncbi:MAG: acyl-CoA dehydrogenase family protein, partial [Chloroflexi bacterium]|nr:acyl-CoA dehydrogenase family protein [Chloroflexota bacterium]